MCDLGEHAPLLEEMIEVVFLSGLLGVGGINFLIETPGKFMEDEKASSSATPHHYANEFMQMC